jgi:hypothetical protein
LCAAEKNKLPEGAIILLIVEEVPAKWLIDTLQTSAVLEIVATETEVASGCYVPESPLVTRLSESPLKNVEVSKVSYRESSMDLLVVSTIIVPSANYDQDMRQLNMNTSISTYWSSRRCQRGR